jgi:hypothetical protein
VRLVEIIAYWWVPDNPCGISGMTGWPSFRKYGREAAVLSGTHQPFVANVPW